REVLPDIERAENPPPLGHQPYAHPCDPVGGHAGDIGPVEDHLSPAGRGEADNGADQRGLPHAVPSQYADDRPPFHLEGETLEDMALSVVSMDIFHFQHYAPPYSAPRYISSTLRSALILSG